MPDPSSPTPVPATTERDPEIAIIKVRDDVDGMTGWAWPIVERVPGGWQSGAHHYPDADVLSVRLLAVSSPPAGDTTTETRTEYRVRGAHPGLGKTKTLECMSAESAADVALMWSELGWLYVRVESRTVSTTRTESPWEEEQ